MAQAQEEANRTIDLAREKAEGLVSKDGISQEAQHRADQILNQARVDAEATRQDADDYVIDTLGRLQEELEKSLNQVRNGIRKLEEERMRSAAPPPPASATAEKQIEEK